MRLVHVVARVDDEASGLTQTIPRLCDGLACRGHDVELSCIAARSASVDVRVETHPQWPILDRVYVAPSHALALLDKAKNVDVVHNHCLWSMVNVFAGWVVPGRRAKLVTSPHGTLARWALDHKRIRKRLFWPLQLPALSRASLLHATSEAEYDDIRALGLSAPIVVIPNGVDLPTMSIAGGRRLQRTLLFLGRIHPIKGIDLLLRAWQVLQGTYVDWRLVVVGCGESGYESEIRDLVRTLALERVEFPGPMFGDEKSRAYFDADLCVVPSHTENFGMVVAEALAHACPVVVSRGAPWSRLPAEGCGWWIGQDVPALAAALRVAMALPREELSAMGRKGRAWMERDFGWDAVALRMESAYRWILGSGDRPATVRTD